MVSHHLKPNCKSLYQKFDVLLTLSFIAGHLALNYSHIAGVFSPPMSFTLLPLEQNVPQIYMWLLFISSNPLLGWLFSIVFHNQRSPFSPLQKQNPSPKSCWALPLSLLFSVKWTSFFMVWTIFYLDLHTVSLILSVLFQSLEYIILQRIVLDKLKIY